MATSIETETESKPVRKVTVASFTPVKRGLSFDAEPRTSGGEIAKVIRQWLEKKGRTYLDKNDEDFLIGLAALANTRYARDILDMVRQSDSVEFSITEREEY